MFPGAYKIRRGAVPDQAVASDTRRPPTSRRDHAGSSASTATAAFFLCFEMSDDKRAERTRALARRAAAFALHGRAAGERLARHGLDFLAPLPGAVVCGFPPFATRSTRPRCSAAGGRGHRLALPVMQGKGNPLLFGVDAGRRHGQRHVGHRRAEGRQARARARHCARAAAGFRSPTAGGWATAAASTTARCRLARAQAGDRGGSWPTTSRRSTRCRVSTTTSGSTGC